jgi:hypothetical protein
MQLTNVSNILKMILNILYIFVTASILSSTSIAKTILDDQVESSAFSIVKNVELYNVKKEEYLVDNMPYFKRQGGFAICSSCSSAIIIQKFICDSLKITDCTNVTEVSSEYSINALALFARANPIDPLPQKKQMM